MEAGRLQCPSCGVPVRRNDSKCNHCGTELATIACPSCFSMVFKTAKFCGNCGNTVERSAEGISGFPCPKCQQLKLSRVQLGTTPVNECPKCQGLFVDAAVFDQLCADRERHAAVLGSASESFRPGDKKFDPIVRYVRCPVCSILMHRLNFAKCSGVVVDVCKGHGTWFDRDELQHIVEFIRRGGMDVARQKEKAELDVARRRLEAARASSAGESNPRALGGPFGESDLVLIAGSILASVLDS